ncbi:MAG: thioredoxin family protein [Chitinophagaceae bacterium]|nr:thioredoxin family protein [Chitinophagaceae bacterium]
MKKIFIIAFLFIVSYNSFAQAQYEVTLDPKHPEVKIFRGIVNKYLVENEASFAWFKTAKVGYKPDTATINAFERNKAKVQFVVFGGTWCEDTQYILPKFFALQEKSGVPDNAITFFGVNREKKSLSSIAEAFNIKNVPTIIIMKDGVEKGRVVEYGKTGNWDKELAQILNAL